MGKFRGFLVCRPAYRRLGELRSTLPGVPCMALTATATPSMISDIAQVLHGDFMVVASSFRRSNLRMSVKLKSEGQRGTTEMLSFVRGQANAVGIVFCRTRHETEAVCRSLRIGGVHSDYFHAGLNGAVKAKKLRAWQSMNVGVMVATIAFGMGIDKSNVRFVVHWNMPSSLHSYFQEIGRAGRDGLPAACLLMYCKADVLSLESMAAQHAATYHQHVQEIRRMEQWCVQRQLCRHLALLRSFSQPDDAVPCDGACDVCCANIVCV
jgi:RecQ family ATP-dependent DNA helicase